MGAEPRGAMRPLSRSACPISRARARVAHEPVETKKSRSSRPMRQGFVELRKRCAARSRTSPHASARAMTPSRLAAIKARVGGVSISITGCAVGARHCMEMSSPRKAQRIKPAGSVESLLTRRWRVGRGASPEGAPKARAHAAWGAPTAWEQNGQCDARRDAAHASHTACVRDEIASRRPHTPQTTSEDGFGIGCRRKGL